MWAALYPGQGSQFPGMGKWLYDEFKLVRELFEEASDGLGLDFKKLCFTADEEELASTKNAQPALLLTSIAAHRVVESLTDLNFQAGAGHSVGEYAALVAAKTLSFQEALPAVRQRGEFMQSAVPLGEGGMLAVLGLSREQAQDLCRWAEKQLGKSPLTPANDNAPGQVVISGKQELVDHVKNNFDPSIFTPQPKKVRLMPLKVSAPFHSPMMAPAEESMRRVLTEIQFQNAPYPIVQNYSAESVQEAATLRENLIRQISAPVRWVECVEKLGQLGVKQAVELGCGKVLSGLLKKINPEITVYPLNSLEDLKRLEAIRS